MSVAVDSTVAGSDSRDASPVVGGSSAVGPTVGAAGSGASTGLSTELVVGMPLYGQAFTLDSATTTGLNSPARRKGAAGQFTRAAGFLAYYEVTMEKWNQH